MLAVNRAAITLLFRGGSIKKISRKFISSNKDVGRYEQFNFYESGLKSK